YLLRHHSELKLQIQSDRGLGRNYYALTLGPLEARCFGEHGVYGWSQRSKRILALIVGDGGPAGRGPFIQQCDLGKRNRRSLGVGDASPQGAVEGLPVGRNSKQ